MDQDNEIIEIPEPTVPPEPKRPSGNGKPDPAAEKIARADDQALIDYFTSLAGGNAIQIKVKRLQPQTFRGKLVGGLLDTLDEFITEEDIKERYGGGKFEIRCFRANPQGKFVFAGQRTVMIAGEPNLSSLPHAEEQRAPIAAPVATEDAPLSKHALSMVERQAERESARAERLEREMRESRGTDTLLLKTMTEPLQRQVDLLQSQLAARDKQIVDLLTNKEDPAAHKLLERVLIEEQSRLATVRTAHESELRALRESMNQEIKRAEDRADRLIDQASRAHDREVQSLRDAHAQSIENVKTSYEARLEMAKAEAARLQGEVTTLKAELVALREKKDIPLPEQIAQIAQIKELLGAVGVGDSEGGGVWEQVLEKFGPVLEGIGARIGGIDPNAMLAMQHAAAGGGGPGVSGPPAPVQGAPRPQIDPAQVAQAIAFIEQAIANDVPPDGFARAIQNSVPKPIVDLIRAQGVDNFVDAVAKRNENSPIATQAGKNFVRAVIAELSKS